MPYTHLSQSKLAKEKSCSPKAACQCAGSITQPVGSFPYFDDSHPFHCRTDAISAPNQRQWSAVRSFISIGARRRGILVSGTLLAAIAFANAARAQEGLVSPLAPAPIAAWAIASKEKEHPPPEKDPGKPSVSIPVNPLGFAPPATFYLGERVAQASLDFLDEDTILFTFRVPGLIRREAVPRGEASQGQRHIRAVTLDLSTGKVMAESLWVLHDYSRYLWVLKDGTFLLRDKNMLQVGNPALHLEPFMRFPGNVLAIEFDPKQQWLVADTAEPPAVDPASDSRHNAPGNSLIASNSPTATIGISRDQDSDSDPPHAAPQNLVRVLSMDTHKVMLYSRVRAAVHLPVDGEGYYDALRGDGTHWMINYEYFQGQSKPVGWVDSTCNPSLDVISTGMVLASACTNGGARHLTVLSRDQEKDHGRVWDQFTSATRVWPVMRMSSNNKRLAREALEVSHPIGAFSPLDGEDIRGQIVQVYDLATGRVALTVPASPVLDGGGNFALSPSGNRVAVLHGGSILVFDLPPAPDLPTTPGAQAAAAKP